MEFYDETGEPDEDPEIRTRMEIDTRVPEAIKQVMDEFQEMGTREEIQEFARPPKPRITQTKKLEDKEPSSSSDSESSSSKVYEIHER